MKFVSCLTAMVISTSTVLAQHHYVLWNHASTNRISQCNSTSAPACRSNPAWTTVAYVPAASTVPHATVANAADAKHSDIVDTAVSAGSFKTLVAAVKAAGLVETLKGKGPFTVFAPTDDAFAKLPAGTVENLLKPENKDQLISVLTYHVVPGKVMASDVVKVKSAKTVQGQSVTVAVEGGKVKIDDANVVKIDIACSNGVIHVIDSVILPKAASPAKPDIVDTAIGAGTFETLVAAVKAAGLVETLKGEGPFTVFAPSDDAFAKLPKGTVENLLKPENKDQLVAVLTYHVVPGKLKASDVVAKSELPTVNGKSAKITTENGAAIAGSKIVATDIECSNGIVHVIDSVMLP
ncbi:MAG: fasciclin domain-containing protein [Planctomycetaceae bacterium]